MDCADSGCSADPSCAGNVQVFDHLECYKTKSAEKMKGVVDVDPGTNLPFALASGCTVLKASKYCVPVARTVGSLDPSVTPDASVVGQELTDDRICYKVKCSVATIPTITVHDQFGTHTVEKFKASEICTPAHQVP